MGTPIRLLAPAKVNLYLGVHPGRDERGYHRVDSVMAALALCDEVTVEPASALEVRMTPGIGAPIQHSNVYKAAARLAEAYGLQPAARVSVTQRVPMRAGLGGSSSDAGATLRGLCRLWGIDCRDEKVARVARSVGADVPFFLDPRPSWLVGGGDVLRESFAPLPPLPVVLVKPADGVSTSASYADFDARAVPEGPLEPLLAALRAADAPGALAHASNNLDPVACRLLPADAEVKRWLAAQPGVAQVLVTGSGSCVFAAVDAPATAVKLAGAAQARGWWSCATEFADVSRAEFC